MNQRIQQLREQSLNAVNRLTVERARLITEFYRNSREYSAPVQRAECFNYILSNKFICINPGELIVGERGPAPKATPTYPEVNLHSLDDLDILDSRPKVSFKVDAEMRRIYKEEIIPFWSGKSHRERMLKQMSAEWISAYRAGIYTEFQEQRAPGHTVLGNKIYQLGMLDIIRQIDRETEQLDFALDMSALDKREELKGMRLSAEALISFALRHAIKLEEMAEAESHTERKNELLEIAGICRKVPAHAPRTFHEALQYYWFVHLGVITELNPWDSFNPGRLDQHLIPFYRQGMEDGSLTQAAAKLLLAGH